ncbi:radical SAM/SPASM domain-containing protein [Calycomorphotria hydatis]|uniref:Antilisterial bacteriocin subtilosin biosynthesis protein AlbA n=1 Tax=Calycomorphotria hydatis TaxID=2528027 RepID=A0A517T6D0_9PLAN|nr:radical SAM/SPASM domain-containing protein [Calycomorphotria hydatis]QDT63933.1 Antilisterial bacteriocin subtilosin biosynthesis protein AlbA [Calycomorphotria hydatis]
MYLSMARRLAAETDKRLLWKLIWNFGFGGAKSVFAHRRRLKRGEFFPPFFYVSIINSCNLRCQGCWVDVAHDRHVIDLDAMNKLIREAKEMGNRFFGLVGGEPFMHPELLDILEQNPDCYFQIFTNGQFITDEVAQRLRKAGNATPLISVEGDELVSDERRGRSGVFNKTMRGIDNCLKHKVLTGVCTSVCRTNIDDLVNEAWIDRLIEKGVLYTWFHVYRPMGPDPNPDLCLTREQQKRVRKFVVEMRAKKPIGIVDAYYDGEGRALCPAATGISHHINPWGGIEPCPIIQFAKESIHDTNPRTGETDNRHLREKFLHSEFLADFRQLAQSSTRGCIVLERPDLLKSLVDKHHASDETARQTAAAELEALTMRTSQYHPGDEIPEKSWAYRLAKRFLFSDFGVYNGHDHSQSAAPYLLKDEPAAPEPELVQLT